MKVSYNEDGSVHEFFSRVWYEEQCENPRETSKEALFWFGKDVLEYIENLHKEINRLNSHNKNTKMLGRVNRIDYFNQASIDKVRDQLVSAFNELGSISNKLQLQSNPEPYPVEGLIKENPEPFEDPALGRQEQAFPSNSGYVSLEKKEYFVGPKSLKSIIYETVGHASMCWKSEGSDEVFDTDEAAKCVENCLKEISQSWKALSDVEQLHTITLLEGAGGDTIADKDFNDKYDDERDRKSYWREKRNRT